MPIFRAGWVVEDNGRSIAIQLAKYKKKIYIAYIINVDLEKEVVHHKPIKS